MSRSLVLTLVAVMLCVVTGQAIKLQQYQTPTTTEIRLYDSRLVAFLMEIRSHNPQTHDSILLNLARIRDGQALSQDYQLEESIVAEKLFGRLSGAK